MAGSETARPARSERGAGSIMAVAVIAGAVVTFAALAPLSLVLQAKVAAAGAADAAALAAADAAVGIIAGPPCERAGEVATANETKLRACQVDGVIVTVRVAVTAAGFDVGATATAGPAPQ
ncbi:secretion/DNA translocation related TadE-like protein [Marisediminicola sp. UYEF4]|uniref:Rv3654c family TadE-like protein n=1 Tax=Marisediminicola sp. UYEF4 TaxID=1756384 RepID=UPI0033960C56